MSLIDELSELDALRQSGALSQEDFEREKAKLLAGIIPSSEASPSPTGGLDSSPVEGWWQTADGKWYAPELHPDYRPPLATSSSPVESSIPLPPAAQTRTAGSASTSASGTGGGHSEDSAPLWIDEGLRPKTSTLTTEQTGGGASRKGKTIAASVIVAVLVLVTGIIIAVASGGGTNPATAAVQQYINAEGNNANGVNVTPSCSFTGSFENGAKVYSCQFSGTVEGTTGDQTMFAENMWGTCFDVSEGSAYPSSDSC